MGQDFPSTIELTRNGPVVSGAADSLRDRFAAQQCVVLRSLLAPQLLEDVQRRLEQAQWQSGDDYAAGSGTLLTSNDPAISTAIHFLLNNPEFLRLVGTITGCGDISEFRFGAIYRMVGEDRHQLSWHDDLPDEDASAKENRQVGLSLNLSTSVFRGGVFELRERSTQRLLAQVSNTGFGDALLFRVSPDLEHRVTQIEDGAPKTAFTGWFCASGESYLKGLISQMQV